MALSKNSVKQAKKIFKQINPSIQGRVIEYWEQYPPEPARVYGIGPKADGGWEGLFIYVHSITTEQWQIWNELKLTVHNTPLKPEVKPPLTRIGFY
jgi:hypothetical protein